MAYQIRSNQHLPYGGEREGADDDHRSNDDKRSNRASPLQLPLSLPRRGGTDTLDCLIVNGLSD